MNGIHTECPFHLCYWQRSTSNIRKRLVTVTFALNHYLDSPKWGPEKFTQSWTELFGQKVIESTEASNFFSRLLNWCSIWPCQRTWLLQRSLNQTTRLNNKDFNREYSFVRFNLVESFFSRKCCNTLRDSYWFIRRTTYGAKINLQCISAYLWKMPTSE